MKIHYYGKYSGQEQDLPAGALYSVDIPFKEPQSMKKLSLLLNTLAILLLVLLCALWLFHFHTGQSWINTLSVFSTELIIASIGQLLILIPHEYLHGICFKEDCWIFTSWKNSLLFVTGPESMSKNRFIFMCLLPNLILGLLPFLIGMLWPLGTRIQFIPSLLALFGMLNLASGAGDYMNIFNALTQVPKDGKIYMYYLHTYWYHPQDRRRKDCVLLEPEKSPAPKEKTD